MLPADVIVRPVEAALDVPEEAFRRVGGRKPSRRRVVEATSPSVEQGREPVEAIVEKVGAGRYRAANVVPAF